MDDFRTCRKVYVINILGLADSFDNLTGDFEQIIEAISLIIYSRCCLIAAADFSLSFLGYIQFIGRLPPLVTESNSPSFRIDNRKRDFAVIPVVFKIRLLMQYIHRVVGGKGHRIRLRKQPG